MLSLSDRQMADFTCLDPVYADGVAGVVNLGENFGMVFYRWVPRFEISGSASVYEKQPVLYLIRPRTSLLSQSGGVAAALRESAAAAFHWMALH